MHAIKTRHAIRSGRKILGHQPDVAIWGPSTIWQCTVDMPHAIGLLDQFQWRPLVRASEVSDTLAIASAFDL